MLAFDDVFESMCRALRTSVTVTFDPAALSAQQGESLSGSIQIPGL